MQRSISRRRPYALALLLAGSPGTGMLMACAAHAGNEPSTIADILDRTRSAAADLAQTSSGGAENDVPADPRAGDKDYEQARLLLKAVEDVLGKTAEKRADIKKLPAESDFVVPPLWTETREDREGRVKALLEELRVSQKLLDQGRVEREENAKAARAAADEMAVLRRQLADRDIKVQSLEGSLREATLRVDTTLAQLSERSEELAKVSLQLKDARMELDVSESGSTVTTSQISQLQRERDELAALVEQLRPRRQVSRPFA